MKKLMLFTVAAFFAMAVAMAEEPAAQPKGEEPKPADQPKEGPAQGGSKKPNPFDKFFKTIKKLEDQKAKLDATKDAKKIDKISEQISKQEEQKKKLQEGMTGPLEKKLEDLQAKVDKLREKKGDQGAIDKMLKDIEVLNNQIDEIVRQASGDDSSGANDAAAAPDKDKPADPMKDKAK